MFTGLSADVQRTIVGGWQMVGTLLCRRSADVQQKFSVHLYDIQQILVGF